jgi:hypothetical protein
MFRLIPVPFDSCDLAAASRIYRSELQMAKPHRPLKKANHGKRPANAKARKAKRRMIKT